MAIELTRNRVITASETKVDGARLLAVEHTARSKALQESYHAVLQVTAAATVTLPTEATNLGSIRYIYLETNDPITIGLKNTQVGLNEFQEIKVEPLVLNGLAIFECDINATHVRLENGSATSVHVHVFVAGDTA